MTSAWISSMSSTLKRSCRKPFFEGLRDTACACADRVARVEIENTAAGPHLVERIIVPRIPRRIVVGVDEIAADRIDELRHLIERQDLERHGLIGLRILHRQPLVATLAVTNQVRWQTVATKPLCRSSRIGISALVK